MLCQICKKKEATIILYKIVNGKRTEIHICEDCAALFTNKLSVLALPQFNLNNLLIGLLSAIDFYGKDEDVFITKELKCHNCNLTYEEFKQSGKLGCSKCYYHFREKLKPLLIKLHGCDQHTGKIPRRAKGKLFQIKKIAQLKKELKEAVLKEKYEEAAKIRDEIIKHERAKKQEDA